MPQFNSPLDPCPEKLLHKGDYGPLAGLDAGTLIHCP